MSSGDNPFEISTGSIGDRAGGSRDVVTAEVSSRTIEMLNQTRPWVQFIGVLMWIGAVFLGVATVILFFTALNAGGGLLLGIALAYGLMVLVYAVLAGSLTGYASKINALRTTENVRDLEDALEQQKKFWRLLGIITLVVLIIYLLALLFGVAGALALIGGR